MLQLSESRVVAAEVGTAYDVVLRTPLTDVFRRRHLAFPPITEVRDVDGGFDQVGQGRTLVMADGGTARETLTSVDRPRSFGYALSDVTGPLKLLVSTVEGRWSFAPDGAGDVPGTRVTWEWRLHATNPVTARLLPVLGPMWHGYARKALAEVDTLVRR